MTTITPARCWDQVSIASHLLEYADADDNQAHERNLTVSQFIILWLGRAVTQPKGTPGQLRRPSYEALNVENWERPTKTRRPQNYQGDFYDLQQIPWEEKLHVNREDARALRDSWYTSYHNVEYTPSKVKTS